MAESKAAEPEGVTRVEDVPFTRVSDVIDDPSKWAEYPQIDIETITGRDVVLRDVMIFPSQDYRDDDGNPRDWAIVLWALPESGELATSATGGSVAVRKLRTLRDEGRFPIIGAFELRAARTKGNQAYVDLR